MKVRKKFWMAPIIIVIDDAKVIERILRHLNIWDPPPDPVVPRGSDPPWPHGEAFPLTYHPAPDIA